MPGPKKPRKPKAAPQVAPPVEEPVVAPVASVEAPADVVGVSGFTPIEENRVEEPEAEAISLSIAEEVGILPDVDRRAPEVVEPPPAEPAVEPTPEPVNQNDHLNAVRQRPDGVKVNAHGSVIG